MKLFIQLLILLFLVVLCQNSFSAKYVSDFIMTDTEFTNEQLLDGIVTPAVPASGKVKFYAKTNGRVYVLDEVGTESDLLIGGEGISPVITHVTNADSPYSVVASNNVFAICDTSSGPITILLPNSTAVNDTYFFSIGLEDATNPVTISTASGSQSIGESSTKTLYNIGQVLRVMSDYNTGTNSKYVLANSPDYLVAKGPMADNYIPIASDTYFASDSDFYYDQSADILYSPGLNVASMTGTKTVSDLTEFYGSVLFTGGLSYSATDPTTQLFDINNVQLSNDLTSSDSIISAINGLQDDISSLSPNHNDLSNIQGGTTDSYYHLTATENSYVSGVYSQSLLTTASPSFEALNVASLSVTYNIDTDEITVSTATVSSYLSAATADIVAQLSAGSAAVDTTFTAFNGDYVLGEQNGYGRYQIWNRATDAILRLGSSQSDGDPTDAVSEGIVVYSENEAGDAMSTDNFSYARIKNARFGLYESNDTVPFANYFWRVDKDSMYFRPLTVAGTKSIELFRDSGNITASGTVTAATGDFTNLVLPTDITIAGELTASTGNFVYLNASDGIITNDLDITGTVTAATGDFTNLVLPTDITIAGELTASTGNFVYLNASEGIITNDLDITGTVTAATGDFTTFQLGSATPIISYILDQDDMASDSEVALVTQQSLKAYVDNAVSGVSTDTVSALGGWVNDGAIGITATTTNPVKGTVGIDNVWWRYSGNSIEVRVEFYQSNAGTVGSGDYLFEVPNSLQIDTSEVTPYSTTESAGGYRNYNVVGSGNVSTNNVGGECAVSVYDSTHVRLFCITTVSSQGAVGSSLVGIGNTPLIYTFKYTVPIVGSAATLPLQQYCYLFDAKTSGTDGGDFNPGSWRERDLNVYSDTGDVTGASCTFLSFATDNEFQLDAGKYEFTGWPSARDVGIHQSRLYDVTNSSDVMYGITTEATGENTTISILSGFLDIATETTYRIEHRATIGASTTGFGIGAGFGNSEVFTKAELKKIE